MAKETKKAPGAPNAPTAADADASAPVNWDQFMGPTGLEGVRQEDLGLPFLMILQSNSPEIKKTDPKFIRGAAIGDIINTLSREIVYKEEGGSPILFLPAAYDKMFMEWKPRESGGGIVKAHRDAAILAETTRDPASGRDVLKNGNLIVTTAYFFGLRLPPGGEAERSVIGLSSTQLKKARGWLQLAMALKHNGKPLPLFSHIYRISTVHEFNAKGDWYGWKIEVDRMVQEANLISAGADIARNTAAQANRLLAAPATETDEAY